MIFTSTGNIGRCVPWQWCCSCWVLGFCDGWIQWHTKSFSTPYGQAFVLHCFHRCTDVKRCVIKKDFLSLLVSLEEFITRANIFKITFPCLSNFIYLLVVLEIFTKHSLISDLQSCSHFSLWHLHFNSFSR